MRTLFIGLALFISAILPAQDRVLDSLQLLMNNTPVDSGKVNIQISMAKELRKKGHLDKSSEKVKEAIALAHKSGFVRGEQLGLDLLGRNQNKGGQYTEAITSFKSGLAIALEAKSRYIGSFHEGLGNCYSDQGHYEEALKEYEEGLAAAKASGYTDVVVHCSNNCGIIYMNQGKYPEAVKCFITALKLAEASGNKKSVAHDYYMIGNVYYFQDNLVQALDNYNKSANLYHEIGYTDDLGPVYTNRGIVNRRMGHLEEALKDYTEALKLVRFQSDKKGEAETLIHMGVLSRQLKKFPEAIDQINEAIRISGEIREATGYADAYNELGATWMEMGKMPQGIAAFQKALTLAKALQNPITTKMSYEGLADLYSRMHNYEEAYRYFKQATILNDSLVNKDNNKQIAEMNVKYESEKKDRELKLNEVEIKSQKAESEKKKILIIAMIIGLALVGLFSLFILRGYGQIKKAHRIIAKQKVLVEEKNKDITDSINYAKRIQEAILPSSGYLGSLFKESFILFKPKDIVSGDFYWFSEKNGIRLIAAVDCTGHGVPGAFMSMIGNAFLNEIVNEKDITSPSLILSELREMIIGSLKQKESNNKDGMDICLLAIDEKKHSIVFAGANNPLWRSSNESGTWCITEYKASKQPIGQYGSEALPFEEHTIPHHPGDWFYLFTDGYADQFGGPKGKKFKYKPFQELLLAHSSKDGKTQQQNLDENFDHWKMGFEQVDDVLVIGARIPV
jgi:tetratricopeptide (TPR) repeat protein